MCYLKQCVGLHSLVEGTPVLHSGYGVKGDYRVGIEKLCKDGWLDVELGICHKGLKSLRKGELCKPDEVGAGNEKDLCPTNVKGRRARCRKPLMSNNDRHYCDLEGNDDEWVAAQKAVI